MSIRCSGAKWRGAAGAALLLFSVVAGAGCGTDEEPNSAEHGDASAAQTGEPTPADAGRSGGGPASSTQGSSGAPQPVVTSDAAVPRDAGSSVTLQDAGGAAGGGAADAAPSVDGASAASHPDLGKGDGKDVITIGDSWMNYIVNGGGIERGLLEASGQKYRTYGVAGTKLLDEVIPNQYEAAKRANPNIKTVVMTGGGNDILLGFSLESAMSVIDKVGARLDKLWQEMAKDGVQDVVYIEYSQGGTNADNVKYGIQKVQPICDNAKGLRCHFMLSDPIIMMMLLDGIHPTADGCTKLGKAVYELMVKEGMRR